MSALWRHPIHPGSLQADNRKIIELERANDHLALEAARWHGAFEGLAAREQELLAEVESLKKANEYLAQYERTISTLNAEVERLRGELKEGE